MNRRSLIQILIGVIAAIAGLMSVILLRQGRCSEANGTWDGATQACIAAGGAIPIARFSDLVAGFGMSVFVALLLYRITTFIYKRQSRSAV
jgi:hypothetical protein